MKEYIKNFIDDIPAIFREILCFFIGHKRCNGGWDGVELCTRCYQFVPKKKK